MSFAIAPTDIDWFFTLKREALGSEVNFWTPTDWKLKCMSKGDPWYFMLKSPVRKIGGFGLFKEYKTMRTSEAWKTFGLSNGVYDLEELIKRTQSFAEKHVDGFSHSSDPVIGCIVLSDPMLFDDEDFFKPETYGYEFSKYIVKFKQYKDPEIPFSSGKKITADTFELRDPSSIGKKRVPVKDRVGQTGFRRSVLRAYRNRCAITKRHVAEVLEASHIQPYIDSGSNHIGNGLCLRADLHKLFDVGLIAVSEDNCLLVSEKLEVLSKGYGKLAGKKLNLPSNKNQWPSQEALKYHRDQIFIG